MLSKIVELLEKLLPFIIYFLITSESKVSTSLCDIGSTTSVVLAAVLRKKFEAKKKTGKRNIKLRLGKKTGSDFPFPISVPKS